MIYCRYLQLHERNQSEYKQNAPHVMMMRVARSVVWQLVPALYFSLSLHPSPSFLLSSFSSLPWSESHHLVPNRSYLLSKPNMARKRARKEAEAGKLPEKPCAHYGEEY